MKNTPVNQQLEQPPSETLPNIVQASYWSPLIFSLVPIILLYLKTNPQLASQLGPGGMAFGIIFLPSMLATFLSYALLPIMILSLSTKRQEALKRGSSQRPYVIAMGVCVLSLSINVAWFAINLNWDNAWNVGKIEMPSEIKLLIRIWNSIVEFFR